MIGLGGFGVPGTWVDVEFGQQTYTTEGETALQIGCLCQPPSFHAAWFRINTGIGIGGIQVNVTSRASQSHEEEYDTYDVRYQNNSVGYLGVGFGSKLFKASNLDLIVGHLFMHSRSHRHKNHRYTLKMSAEHPTNTQTSQATFPTTSSLVDSCPTLNSL